MHVLTLTKGIMISNISYLYANKAWKQTEVKSKSNFDTLMNSCCHFPRNFSPRVIDCFFLGFIRRSNRCLICPRKKNKVNFYRKIEEYFTGTFVLQKRSQQKMPKSISGFGLEVKNVSICLLLLMFERGTLESTLA